MRRIYSLSAPVRALIAFGLVVALALLLLSGTFMGRRVSAVFSNINSGLAAGGGYSAPVSAPAAPASSSAYPLPAAAAASDRMVIRSASLQIEVADVTAADAAIRAAVAHVGGYVTSSAAYGEGDDLQIALHLSVPADQFDATLSAAQALAAKVRSRSVSGQDVTEEFVDLEARLRNLELTRDRVQGLMDQARRIDEMLQINTTLSDLQGQIEQIQGRMRYLSQSASFSTIELSLMPVPVVPLVAEEGWQPVAVARGALADVIAAGQGIINLVIILAIWAPLIAPPLLLVGWVWRRLRRGAGESAARP